jgi:PhnB protein
MAVKPIPEGYHSVTPYLIVDGAGALIDFMKQAFDAEETVRMDTPDGKIGHAEFRIGDSIVMLADSATSDWDAMPATVVVYVEDVDKTYRRALEAGGTSVRDVADQFYGDRAGGVRDSVGNHWWIHTHVEDVPPEEMARRAQEWQAQQQS